MHHGDMPSASVSSLLLPQQGGVRDVAEDDLPGLNVLSVTVQIVNYEGTPRNLYANGRALEALGVSIENFLAQVHAPSATPPLHFVAGWPPPQILCWQFSERARVGWGMGVLLTGGVCQDPTAGGSETETAKWRKRREAVQLNKETVWAAPAPPPHPCRASTRWGASGGCGASRMGRGVHAAVIAISMCRFRCAQPAGPCRVVVAGASACAGVV